MLCCDTLTCLPPKKTALNKTKDHTTHALNL